MFSHHQSLYTCIFIRHLDVSSQNVEVLAENIKSSVPSEFIGTVWLYGNCLYQVVSRQSVYIFQFKVLSVDLNF